MPSSPASTEKSHKERRRIEFPPNSSLKTSKLSLKSRKLSGELKSRLGPAPAAKSDDEMEIDKPTVSGTKPQPTSKVSFSIKATAKTMASALHKQSDDEEAEEVNVKPSNGRRVVLMNDSPVKTTVAVSASIPIVNKLAQKVEVKPIVDVSPFVKKEPPTRTESPAVKKESSPDVERKAHKKKKSKRSPKHRSKSRSPLPKRLCAGADKEDEFCVKDSVTNSSDDQPKPATAKETTERAEKKESERERSPVGRNKSPPASRRRKSHSRSASESPKRRLSKERRKNSKEIRRSDERRRRSPSPRPSSRSTRHRRYSSEEEDYKSSRHQSSYYGGECSQQV